MSRIQQILERAEREGVLRSATIPMPAAGAPQQIAPLDRTASGDSLKAARLIVGASLAPWLISSTSQDTVAVEQYRALRTRILHSEATAPARTLLITSSGRGEGKTVTAANLALVMAQEHRHRVCLVDANLRGPGLQSSFGLPGGPGLCDVLLGRTSIADALIELEEHDLTILPAGHVPSRPADLLGGVAMQHTLALLRQHFDRVIVDAPAATPLADVSILTPLVDALLLVVRAGVTMKPAIRRAVAAVDRIKLLGLVLNESA